MPSLTQWSVLGAVFATLAYVAKPRIEDAQAREDAKPAEVKRKELNEYNMRNVVRTHDDEKGVTCWVIERETAVGVGAGISCLPDGQILGGKAGN